jgi:TM2 domain-containing membrane protein YozV
MSEVAKAKAQDEKFCESCGEIIKVKAVICPKCGVPQHTATEGKNKTTAGILALLLGGLGAHKFYLGKTGMGILYLVFCWTLVPAVIALVEGILYLTSSEEEFLRKYVNR